MAGRLILCYKTGELRTRLILFESSADKDALLASPYPHTLSCSPLSIVFATWPPPTPHPDPDSYPEAFQTRLAHQKIVGYLYIESVQSIN